MAEERPRNTMRDTGDAPEQSVSEAPLVVAYDTGDRFTKSEAVTTDAFYDALNDYDAVIVTFEDTEGDSQPNTDTSTQGSQKHQYFLLYGDVKNIDLAGLDAERIDDDRDRGRLISGDFNWIDHGTSLAVQTSVGFHCRDHETWEELP